MRGRLRGTRTLGLTRRRLRCRAAAGYCRRRALLLPLPAGAGSLQGSPEASRAWTSGRRQEKSCS